VEIEDRVCEVADPTRPAAGVTLYGVESGAALHFGPRRPRGGARTRQVGGCGVTGGAEQRQLDGFEPDLARLVKLTSPERAELYALANLDLAEREYLEVQVRARIRAAVRRQYRRRGA
jgi:hypothetical protein